MSIIGVWGAGAACARSGGRQGLNGWSGGGAKHGGAVRSRGGRRQGTGPVVAAVSRKIVNTDSLEVDEGDLPVLCTSYGAKNGLTYMLSVDYYFHRIL